MSLPTASSPRTTPSHALLHREHHNVKAYGAVGNGVADDTTPIQNALTAAGTFGVGAEAYVFFPPGNYKITSTLTLAHGDIRISGALGSNSDWSGGNRAGVRIFGNIAGNLLEKTVGTGQVVTIEDIGFHNTNATGTCVTLSGVVTPGGIYRCFFRGYKGVVFTTNLFNVPVDTCHFQLGGVTFSGSQAITLSNHTHVYNVDISGYDVGILGTGVGLAVIGGRIETSETGILWGLGGVSGIGLISGISFEGNDTAIYLFASSGTLVTGCRIQGTAAAPSGASLIGIDVNQAQATSVIGVQEAGTHTTAFVRTQTNANRENLVFMGVRSATAWSLSDHDETTIIDCFPENDIIRAPVIATASLPAAGVNENGRIVIEDAGAGNRNLMLYAGGERFRIDGGAAI